MIFFEIEISLTSPHIRQPAVSVSLCSHDSCLLEQEEEGAALAGRRVGELGLGEAAPVPELKPVEVVRALLNVVFHPAMLEEELLVAPVRADRV